jgi:hypothetical protein
MPRLYFWIQGAPESRIGGPWWARDFKTKAERDMFLRDLGPMLHAFALTEGTERLDRNHVRPPADCEVLYPNAHRET